jgi:hypothetical protein
MESEERPLARLHSVRAHAFRQPLQYSRRHDHVSGWVEQRVPVLARVLAIIVSGPPQKFTRSTKGGVWKQHIMLQAALRGGFGYDS